MSFSAIYTYHLQDPPPYKVGGVDTPFNAMAETANDPSCWIKLNVGGTVFLTTKPTLAKDKKSFLHRLCQEDPDLPSLKDENGAYLIDRDPRYFPVILNYLRHGKLIVEPNLCVEGVEEEAEFYNLSSLLETLRSHKEKKEK